MQRQVLRSGSLELDLGVHQVRDGSRPVSLAPRVFNLLHCLMRRAPETVTREELLAEVRADVHVCDSAVAQAVRALRVAIDSGARAPRIVTVRGRGYRFDGVTEVAKRVAVVSSTGRASEGARDMAQRTVLLVNDEPEILEALARTLRTVGCRFVSATSGKDALFVLDREPVDLVVSDIDMPHMTGLELIARVRRSRPHVGRVILTGVASLDTALRAINDGEVHRFLTKPWDADELRRVVHEVLVRVGGGSERAPDAEPAPEEPGSPALSPPLSPRERQTLTELLTGAREKEIAHRLGVSPHTAHQYVKALYRRFKVASRVELIVKLAPTGAGRRDPEPRSKVAPR